MPPSVPPVQPPAPPTPPVPPHPPPPPAQPPMQPPVLLLVTDDVPGIETSQHFACRVREFGSTWQSSFVFSSVSYEAVYEQLESYPHLITNGYFNSLTNWSASWVSFEVAEDTMVEVEITRLSLGGSSDPILRARAHPASRNATTQIVDGKAVITIVGATQLTVDMDGGMDEINTGFSRTPVGVGPVIVHSFSIFANPRIADADRPQPDDVDVRTVAPGETVPEDFNETTLYFLPGVHDLTPIAACCSTHIYADACRCSTLTDDTGYVLPYQLTSGKRYYIPTNAVLNGRIFASNREDVTIFGYGVLSGTKMHWKRYDWDTPKGIFLGSVRGFSITGITLVDFGNHHLILSGSTEEGTMPNTLRNVKVMGWRVNGDGLHLWGYWHEISDLFLRTQDDSLYIGDESSPTTFRRITTWNDANGVPFIFGRVHDGLTEVTDSDVLWYRKQWPWWCGGVFDLRWFTGFVHPQFQLLIHNIRVHDPMPSCPLLDMTGTHANIHFANISVAAHSTFTQNFRCAPGNEWRFNMPEHFGCDMPFGIPSRIFGGTSENAIAAGTDPSSANITNIRFDNVVINGTDILTLVTDPHYSGSVLFGGNVHRLRFEGLDYIVPPPPSAPPPLEPPSPALPPAPPAPPTPPVPPPAPPASPVLPCRPGCLTSANPWQELCTQTLRCGGCAECHS